MGKLILQIFTSLDGYITGPNDEFIPPLWSVDLERYWAGEALNRARHLLYGRVNFIFNKDFWQAAETDPSSPAAAMPHAATMNRLPKTVVSTTLAGDPGWNAVVLRRDLAAGVARLKDSNRGDTYSFGGAGLAQSLIAQDLVDEYRLMVTPNLFGSGKRLFEPGFSRLDLQLVGSRGLDTGAVILHYQRKRPAAGQ
jgi:dihydrofolate reductase